MKEPGNKDTYPCRNCADRTLGCHGVCKDYLEAAAKDRERKAAMKADMPPSISAYDFIGGSGVRHKRK